MGPPSFGGLDGVHVHGVGHPQQPADHARAAKRQGIHEHLPHELRPHHLRGAPAPPPESQRSLRLRLYSLYIWPAEMAVQPLLPMGHLIVQQGPSDRQPFGAIDV